MESLSERFQRELPRFDTADSNYVPQLVSAMLTAARAARPSPRLGADTENVLNDKAWGA